MSDALKSMLMRMAILVVAGVALGAAWNPDALKTPVAPVAPSVSLGISLDEVLPLLESGELVVVDARPSGFVGGHIPGALAAFESRIKPLLSVLREWIPRSARVVVVGAHDQDGYAASILRSLRGFGILDVRLLEGGMAGWQARGLPLAKGWDMAPLLAGTRR